MTLRLHLDHDSRVYLTLSCNNCFTPFTCYDDACYSYTSLRNEAVYAGWDAGTRPEHPHHCPRCAPLADAAAQPASYAEKGGSLAARSLPGAGRS